MSCGCSTTRRVPLVRGTVFRRQADRPIPSIPKLLPNGNGWNNSDVTVTINATDEAGGSGVDSLVYTMSGAQSGGSMIAGSTTSITMLAEGTTTLTYHATDRAGNIESDHTLTIKLDRTPPVGKRAIDGFGIGTSRALVRAERGGQRDGRVYHIGFTATDPGGLSCTGDVIVGVPRNQRGSAAVDSGPKYDSTKPTPLSDEDEHHDCGDDEDHDRHGRNKDDHDRKYHGKVEGRN